MICITANFELKPSECVVFYRAVCTLYQSDIFSFSFKLRVALNDSRRGFHVNWTWEFGLGHLGLLQ